MTAAIGTAMLVVGALVAANSPRIVKRSIRVWPHPIGSRSGEQFLAYEFLVRFTALLIALAGAGLILTSLF